MQFNFRAKVAKADKKVVLIKEQNISGTNIYLQRLIKVVP